MRSGGDEANAAVILARSCARLEGWRRKLASLIQPSQNLVELFKVAVADVHGTAGIAVIDADRQPKRVADALLQRDRIGIFHLAAARLLRLALWHALDMRQRLGLTHVEAFFDDAFGGSSRIWQADQRAGGAGRQQAPGH